MKRSTSDEGLDAAYYTPPFGLPTMTLVAKNNHLITVSWQTLTSLNGQPLRQVPPQSVPVLQQTSEELNDYFNGTRQQFKMAQDWSLFGTPFYQQVWQVLSKIPYGQTLSYQQVAQRIGRPKAYRAVGGAIGKNPIAVIVPCHRVIASDGTIGGYRDGLTIKTCLLKHEGL